MSSNKHSQPQRKLSIASNTDAEVLHLWFHFQAETMLQYQECDTTVRGLIYTCIRVLQDKGGKGVVNWRQRGRHLIHW